MIVLLEVPCDRVPVLKHDITKLLLKYILHDLDDVQIAEIMAQNTNLKPKVDCHSVIAQEGLEGFVDDIVDPDTKADVKEEAANYLKHVKAMKLAAIPKAKAKGKAGPAPKKKRCGAKDLMMCELARKYLPQLEACTLSNETEWHTRFRCFYPTLLPQGKLQRCIAKTMTNLKRQLWCSASHGRGRNTSSPPMVRKFAHGISLLFEHIRKTPTLIIREIN